MQSWEWRIARDDAGEYRFSPVAVHEAAVVTAEVLLAFDVSRPTIIAELEKKFGMTPAEAGEVLHEARRRVGPTDAGATAFPESSATRRLTLSLRSRPAL
ncbi:MAG TPA: hypothetical protein VN636_20030 [Acidimicrobiia bacterium]|nr:hypothetical protein [Acidimicrobiia bacterium]